MSTLGVVIVTYNSGRVIDRCLRGVAPYAHSVVVVDNASSDNTREIVASYPVRLIANRENRGFAAAVNQGFENLQVQFVLLLNPDVYLTSDPALLIGEFGETRTGAATAVLTDEEQCPQTGFQLRRLPTATTLLFEVLGMNRLVPGNPVNRRYRYLGETWQSACDVEQPAGAFAVIRKSVWEQLGGFDERFHPLWFEDVDFFARLAAHGFRTAFVPKLAGIHSGAHSLHTLEPGLRQLYWYRSLLQYAAKHFSGFWVRVLALAAAVAVGGKAVIMLFRTGKPSQLRQQFPALTVSLETILKGRPSAPRADEA